MKLRILSDLHLESPKAYDSFDIVPSAPYLALLGDIGNVLPHKDEFIAFLTAQLKQFRAVLLVPGNHEAYHSSWPDTLAALRAFEQAVHADSSLGTFCLLDRNIFRPPGDVKTAILGCSLFSAVPDASSDAVGSGLNDFFHTGGDWDVAAHNAAHSRDLAWLNAQVAALDSEGGVETVAIFTHWSPTRDPRAADPRHTGSAIASAFATDLSSEACFRNGKVKVWAFGHTHYNCDFTVERQGVSPLRLVTNQRGYYFAQAEGFDRQKTLYIEDNRAEHSCAPVDVI